MGSLTLIFGCMFSGKSLKLIELYNEKKQNNTIFLINYKHDTRYGENVIASHNKFKEPCFCCLTLEESISKSEFLKANIIMIDEAQFFPDLKKFVITCVETYNKELYVAGLDGDYQRQMFGDVLTLIPFADDVIKLKAQCYLCNRKALFTKRISEDIQQIVIGGSESYRPVCRFHYK